MKCPNCSNEVPETANVCGYCGQRLKSAVPPPHSGRKRATQIAESAPEIAQSSQFKWGWLFFGALVLLIFIFYRASMSGSSASKQGWVTVLEENFNDPSSINVRYWKGKVISSELRDSFDEQNGYSSILINDDDSMIENGFRITFESRIIKALDERSGWSLDVYTSDDPDFTDFDVARIYFLVSGASESIIWRYSSGNERTVFKETIFPGFEGVGTSNVIVIEGLNSKISVWGNGQKLYEFEYPVEGYYHELAWNIHNRTEVGFDNLKLEEYHP